MDFKVRKVADPFKCKSPKQRRPFIPGPMHVKTSLMNIDSFSVINKKPNAPIV